MLLLMIGVLYFYSSSYVDSTLIIGSHSLNFEPLLVLTNSMMILRCIFFSDFFS